ncbi:MAG: DUF350 domain-containing protein [Chitinivibrionales bacterium]|nr:DUF350 domain-containing protein [Chitinivibrionales bacterium]MBD3395425.1 DUF350 domain-containing protein [Chitinivibrionales bacterium]
MNRELIVTYFINFAYTLLRAVIYAIGCFFAWRAFDWLDKVDIRKEITENKNLGWAIIVASLLLGLAYVIGQI